MSDLPSLYNARFSSKEKAAKEKVWEVLCQNYFQQYIERSSTVLDIACGFGEFLNNTTASRKIRTDINPESSKHLNTDIEFHLSSADKLDVIADHEIDVVFASNTFEHFKTKAVIEDVLLEILRVLKPGGQFLMMQPNFKYCSKSYWDFFDHHIPLTHLSMIEALEMSGFQVSVVIPKFMPFSTKSKLPTHPFLVSLYLNLPLIWKLMGKQFFVLAVKPAD
jgi:ubiquinone/menaquinone biosynthesis C-methylase UbiE